MKVSIVIATYNADKVLERALKSVIPNRPFELILIDGGSRDNTLSIIKKYADQITYWISEKDNGIYDAWNKGVKVAKGDWIMFLGADDALVPDAIQQYEKFLTENGGSKHLQFVSSKIQMVNEEGRFLRVKGWPWEWPLFLRDMTVAHPGSLHSAALFEKYGLFDSSYKSAGDFEFLLRPKGQLSAGFLPYVTALVQDGGMSDSPIGIWEHRRATVSTGGYSPLKGYLNSYWVYFKFSVKRMLSRYKIYLYLKK